MSNQIGRPLRGSRLFFPLRDAYHFVCKPALWKAAKERTAFYRQFVQPGSLVFDVGANRGEYTRAFLALGARVVSIEPQPHCLRILRTIHNERLIIKPVAVGERCGSTTMRVCSDDGMSSLSNEWIELLGQRYSERTWGQPIGIPIVTLDSIIAEHGQPDFVKIDVEGYEPQVLSGLSFLPRALTFEVNHEWLHSGEQMLDWGYFDSNVRFNWWSGPSPKNLESPEWLTLDDMKAMMKSKLFQERMEPCDIVVVRR